MSTMISRYNYQKEKAALSTSAWFLNLISRCFATSCLKQVVANLSIPPVLFLQKYHYSTTSRTDHLVKKSKCSMLQEAEVHIYKVDGRVFFMLLQKADRVTNKVSFVRKIPPESPPLQFLDCSNLKILAQLITHHSPPLLSELLISDSGIAHFCF